MKNLRVAPAFAGIALLLATASARADITVTLEVNNATIKGTVVSGGGSANNVIEVFNVSGVLFTVDTSMTNNPGSNNMGQLSSTLSLEPTPGGTPPSAITVNVAETLPFTVPSPANGIYAITDNATTNSGTPASVMLQGNAIFDGQSEAPVSFGIPTNTSPVTASPTSYTLGQTFTLSGITSTSGELQAGLISTVTSGSASPAAVPEPSSLVLTGLVSVGLGLVGLRRRLRSRVV